MIKNLLIIIFLIGTSCLLAMDLPKFSTAGFYELPNTGRKSILRIWLGDS